MYKQTSAAAPQLGTCSLDLGEITIEMDSDYGGVRYIGTRLQLEAEGVIPARAEWPDDFSGTGWELDRLSFRLYRQRPKGIKGSRRDFLHCDNWILSVARKDRHLFAMAEHIERKSKDLARLIHEQSPQGEAEQRRRLNLRLAAEKDKKFQAFKALIPGLLPPPRKPRGRKPSVQTQEARHG